jgi:endoribonuclease Nob1
MKILDASGVINAREAFDGEYITAPEIVREIRDIQSRMKLESAIAEGKVRLQEPSDAALDKVEAAAEKAGVLPLLSIPDMKVLALAYETRLPIVTDDYDIQNMCWLLGLGFETIIMPGIKSAFTWKKKCTACGKEHSEDIAECEACGSTRFKVVKN